MLRPPVEIPKPPKEYVTCAVCRNRYVGVVPRGGDGSALFPRKHSRYTGLLRERHKETCPGSYEVGLE